MSIGGNSNKTIRDNPGESGLIAKIKFHEVLLTFASLFEIIVGDVILNGRLSESV